MHAQVSHYVAAVTLNRAQLRPVGPEWDDSTPLLEEREDQS